MLNDKDCSNISDGNHTFGELYFYKDILTAALFNTYHNRCWKTKRNSDGTVCDGYFIVGMNTQFGQIIYHYPLDKWNWFNVKTLYRPPECNNYTSEQNLTRMYMSFIAP